MALYSFQGELPKPLPARVRLENGFTRSNPATYTLDELDAWGYYGPISIPSYDADEKLEWDGDKKEYVKVQLSQEEIEERRLSTLRQLIDYQRFYDGLLINKAYQKIRQTATQNLKVTVACTEFIAAIGDAKAGRPNENAIQSCIFNITDLVVFTAEEKSGLVSLMEETGMSGIYRLEQ